VNKHEKQTDGIPKASSTAAAARMRNQTQRNTVPEVALRSELHRRGLRYRIHFSIFDPRRRHDVVFIRAKVVVDIRGCFWHSCPTHGSLPKANAEWWAEKLRVNRVRDEDTISRLKQMGWSSVVVWEHEDPLEAANRIEHVVRSSIVSSAPHQFRPPDD